MTNKEQSLQHFGIFGMKWGIRRFQNEDGTLTEEGKKRYNQRARDVRAAKEHVLNSIESDKKQRDFFLRDAEAIKNMPRNRKAVKKRMNISDADYDDAIEQFGSLEKYLQYEERYYRNEANSYSSRIRDWNKKMKALENISVDAISSDSQHMKRIEDVFSQSKGLLGRYIDLHDVKNYINYVRRHPEHKLYFENTKTEAPRKRDTLTERFNKAQKDHPNLTYDQIYKEMKVNMNSDDPDDYKDAEDRWFKKHGY